MKDPYFGIKKISQSGLINFERSPMYYKYVTDNPVIPTLPMKFGNLGHYNVLEPHNLGNYIMILDESKRPVPDKNYQTKVNKEWKDAIELSATALDMILLSSNDKLRADDCKEALHRNQQARELLEAGGNKFESGIEWKKGKSECKGKIDVRNEFFLADLKFLENADPGEVLKAIFKRKYHRQGAMYLDGDAGGQLDFADMKDYFIIACENDAPYGVSVHRLTKELIVHAYTEYTTLVGQIQICIDNNHWPDYDFKAKISNSGIFDVDLPNYLKD